jgi:hypothetical protein
VLKLGEIHNGIRRSELAKKTFSERPLGCG